MTPGPRSTSWVRAALTGAALLSVNAMIIAVLFVIDSAKTGDWRGTGTMLVLLVTLWVPGAAAGIVYAALKRLSGGGEDGYYTRWVLAAEAALFVWAAQVVILKSTVFAGESYTPPQDEIDLLVLITNPVGLIFLSLVTAVAGLIYGRVMRS